MSQLDLLERVVEVVVSHELDVIEAKAKEAKRVLRAMKGSEPRPEGWVQQFPPDPPRREPQSTWMAWVRCMPWGWVCSCGVVALRVVSPYTTLCEDCGGNRVREWASCPVEWLGRHRECGR